MLANVPYAASRPLSLRWRLEADLPPLLSFQLITPLLPPEASVAAQAMPSAVLAHSARQHTKVAHTHLNKVLALLRPRCSHLVNHAKPHPRHRSSP